MEHYAHHYETDEESEPEVEVEVEVKPKKRGKKRKDPNKPKKFMTAYILYSNNVRSSVSTANPEAKFGDIARLISKQFKALDEDEKAKWNELARQDKERYQREMENYDPPSDDDEDGGTRKKKKDPNAPKRNMSAFFIYSNDVRPAVRAENPGIKFGDVARLISSKFKGLSTEERAKYDKLAVADKERYQAQMAQYRETGTFD